MPIFLTEKIKSISSGTINEKKLSIIFFVKEICEKSYEILSDFRFSLKRKITDNL